MEAAGSYPCRGVWMGVEEEALASRDPRPSFLLVSVGPHEGQVGPAAAAWPVRSLGHGGSDGCPLEDRSAGERRLRVTLGPWDTGLGSEPGADSMEFLPTGPGDSDHREWARTQLSFLAPGDV